ncbi:MAG: hypothetical protein A2Y64_05520 [Candidatus Coatesbacteria bacterium RBG_13_66_14]|uniref:Uncharacterized protein n=1 Tax=Candidatus Coatesbacteria bacterium RBG_13_66_14 TaxID=1817816 RepID=A0A1F5F7H8_9BACT|nr:MAG: hypothetical protein A2Y64_05520 [Candidatus Coatesbacteria bacterium RBG_13_66_14]
MKTAKLFLLILAFAFLFGLMGCEEEGGAEGENGEAGVLPTDTPTFTAELGEWVTYTAQDVGEITLALVGEEEFGGVPGYWIEMVVPAEGQKVVVKVLVEKEAYEEFGKEVVEWLRNPEIPEEGLLADAMATTGVEAEGEATPEDIQKGLDEFNETVLRLIVEAEGQAFEIDIPSFTKLIGEQSAQMMEMGEEMAEAYGGETEEAEEIVMPTFELVKNVTAEVAGKTYACDKVVVTHEGESAEIFFSPEVPFFGLVKVVAEGEDKLVVTDYGRSGYTSQLTATEPMKIDANALMMMFMGAAMMEGGEMPGGMEGMDPEMLKALEELERMGG